MDEFNNNFNMEGEPSAPDTAAVSQPDSVTPNAEPIVPNTDASAPVNTPAQADFTSQQAVEQPQAVPPYSVPNQPTQQMPSFSAVPPTWHQVSYTEVKPAKKTTSRGLKVFAAVMACVIFATATCVAGYFMGRTSVTAGNGTGKKVELKLESRPKNEDELTPAGVYDKVNKSVVGIRVYNAQGSSSDASGVFYSKDGYIVTNDHIYSEVAAPKFKVYTYDGKEYDAKYVAGDTVSDLAVLKVEGNFSVASFGNSKQLYAGESVVAIGRPGDATTSSSITSGIISLEKRRVKTTSSYTASLIETDSAINPGSSGGALVNMYGQVVGITAAKLAGVVYDSVGYAIPTTTVKRVVEQLIKDGKVTDRAKLGITYTEMNSVNAEINGQDAPGLVVVSVSSDSDATGKLSEGDIITHVNGLEITNDDIMLDVIDECTAGDSIKITVKTVRGDTEELTIVLKANVGESSYNGTLGQLEPSEDNDESASGGTFNFPQGE